MMMTTRLSNDSENDVDDDQCDVDNDDDVKYDDDFSSEDCYDDDDDYDNDDDSDVNIIIFFLQQHILIRRKEQRR